MTVVFFLVAIILAIASIFYVNNATAGVALIAGACFLGIMARLVQAESQHKQLMAALSGTVQRRPAQSNKPDTQFLRYCPACKTTAMPEGAFCSNCGERLPT
jgi:uncharacterized paraquat-inducible protein A